MSDLHGCWCPHCSSGCCCFEALPPLVRCLVHEREKMVLRQQPLIQLRGRLGGTGRCWCWWEQLGWRVWH